MADIVMAYIVMIYIIMACIVTTYIVMAYIVTAYIVMAYIVTAYIVMAYIVMVADTFPFEHVSLQRVRPTSEERPLSSLELASKFVDERIDAGLPLTRLLYTAHRRRLVCGYSPGTQDHRLGERSPTVRSPCSTHVYTHVYPHVYPHICTHVSTHFYTHVYTHASEALRRAD